MTLFAFSVWLIIAPIIAAQYVYATVGLIILSKRELPAKQYALWNIFILLVFFIGCTMFLIYNKVKK